MARRIVFREKSAFYHAMIKTAHDAFDLVDKKDILVLEAFIVLYKEVHNIKIFCQSTMSNHIHFLIQNSTRDPEAISLFFRDFKREFAKYYNTAYGRKGPFWKERMTLKAIESEEQFVNTLVYILNNPVESRKCNVAWDYAFSSFHLPLTKSALKTIGQSIEFMKNDDAFEFIREIKRKNYYGRRLPEKELLIRKKTEVTQGPMMHRHPYKNHCRISDIHKSFAKAITDPFPKNLSLDRNTLRDLCLIQATQKKQNPFKNNGLSILFESSCQKACKRYQKKFSNRLPLGARYDDSIVRSSTGTWQLIVLSGKTKSKFN
jgi:REP element-mobilizing transposase RayT